MRETDMFWGNEICCAAYAFLNTTGDRNIEYKLFEATSSVPFGIKHQREPDYSRLLTTYCDPNIGLDRAAELWGYRQEKKIFSDQEEAASYIEMSVKEARCLVGPVDMGRLRYLMFPGLYKNMDHYVAIFEDRGRIYCTDSEGIPARQITGGELREWLQVSGLPEAKGHITVRTFQKKEKGKDREKKAIQNSIKWIKNNLEEANGSVAIKQCFQWLAEKPCARWKLSFLYDISYLIQRKLLQIYWVECSEKVLALKTEQVCKVRTLVEKQIRVLQEIFKTLQTEDRILEEHFREFAELESRMCEVFREQH